MKILVDGQTLGTPELQRGIGKAFLKIFYHLMDGDVEHDWFIAVHDLAHIEQLKSLARRWIRPVLLSSPAPNDDPIARCHDYGIQIAAISQNIGADVYWNPNPLMPNVRYPLGFNTIPRIVTLYDLIPLMLPERFQKEWGQALWQDYLARCNDLSTGCHLLAISSATSRDFSTLYPSATSQVQVATLASDYSLFWPYIQGDRLSDPPYILYVGGFDPRKNMDNALKAFASFAHAQESKDIRFKVVCAHDSTVRDRYFSLAHDLGVADRLDLPGYVPDEELGYLFRGASVFFFPSLYEGFGLPVLDALACGVPVVASSVSSILEVGGEYPIYCNPLDISDMARALNHAWERRDPNDPRRIAAVEYARSFRWEKTARYYLQAFKNVFTIHHSQHSPLKRDKLRVAYLSPWPPQKTGVADYSYQLIPYLLTQMEITLFVDHPEKALPLTGITIQSIDCYLEQASHYDVAIYHLGNNLAHLKIYEYAWLVPGIIVLHDYNIHPSLQQGFLNQPKQFLYEKALHEYGTSGLTAWNNYLATGNPPDLWEFPMSHPIARHSRAIITHSRWVADQLTSIRHILRIHLGTESQPEISDWERRHLRRQLGMDDHFFWIGIFGFINQNKRINSIMAAAAKLCCNGYPIKLLIVGEVNDTRIDIAALEQHHNLTSVIQCFGYVEADIFQACLKAVDVVANLRYPTMGESSASLYAALANNKPTLTTDFGAFTEIPDSVAWKAVPAEETEIDQLVLFFQSLFKNPAIRHAMSKNSHRFITDKASLKGVAEAYTSLIRIL